MPSATKFQSMAIANAAKEASIARLFSPPRSA
jgi:hypothetical protein